MALGRRTILALGAGAALLAGLGLAIAFGGGSHAPAPPLAPGEGLQIQTGRDDDIRLDPRRPLRCYVGGRFAGELTVAACAKRNGVATGALDVGLDAGGQVQGGLPPAPAVATAAPPAAQAGLPGAARIEAQGQSGEALCLRYSVGSWFPLSRRMDLLACVQALFDGQCVRPGGAVYGRWGDRTLRVVPGRVEISANNRDFRPVAEQGADCDVTALL